MLILGINNNYSYNNQVKPTFCGNSRAVCDNAGKLKYYCTTYFFREHLNWHYLADYLGEKFAGKGRVNVYDYACSSGEEAFTLATILTMRLGKKDSEKFFPIYARDINEENIRIAKSGILPASNYEKYLFESATYPVTNNFAEITSVKGASNFSENACTFRMTPELASKIEFSTANILEDIDNIPHEPTVLLVRNLWRYLNEREQALLMEKIYNKLKGTSSVLIFGGSDSPDHKNILTSGKTGYPNKSYVFDNLAKYDIVRSKLKYVYEIL